MNIGKFKIYWITVRSLVATGNKCLQCLLKGLYSTRERAWVDRLIHNWVDKLFAIGAIHYQVFNPHNVKPEPGKATILMCNHTSTYDIPLSFKAFPQHSIRMLAKKELSAIPIFGSAMRSAEFVFIDRKNRHQAVKDLHAARELMESGILLWIAPEGTRSLNGKLAPFKKGGFVTAIEAKATIIPIVIKGAYEILPAHSMELHNHRTAEIHIGKPIDAKDYTLDQRQELLDKVHQAMEALLA